jgi:CheY-like chemotaxis protein
VKHALVIEDVPIIAMMIQDELAELGFSVTVAATEAQAIALAEVRCPDLIMADARLKEGSGVEAVRQICRDRPIPVIFMTGDPGAVEVAIGEAVLLEKPFTTIQLKSGINTAGPISIGEY